MSARNSVVAAIVFLSSAAPAWGLELIFEGPFRPYDAWVERYWPSGRPSPEPTLTIRLVFDKVWEDPDSPNCTGRDLCTAYWAHISTFDGRSTETADGHLEYRMYPWPENKPLSFGSDYIPGAIRLTTYYYDEDDRREPELDFRGVRLFGGYPAAFSLFYEMYDASGSLVLSRSSGFFSIQLRHLHWFAGDSILDLPSNPDITIDRYGDGGWIDLEPAGKSGFWYDSFRIIHDELTPGDADGDGDFDKLDLVKVMAGGKFATGGLAPWSQGDWNADGRFDPLDLVAAQQAGAYRATPLPAMAVPEPSTVHICLTVFVMVLCSVLRRLICCHEYRAVGECDERELVQKV